VSITDDRGRVVFVNRAYTEILGIALAADAQAYMDGLVPDAEGAQQEEIARGIGEAGEWSGLVWRTRMDDGRRVPLDLFVSAVDGAEGGGRCCSPSCRTPPSGWSASGTCAAPSGWPGWGRWWGALRTNSTTR
jgi:PAS domain-containing protein